MEEPRKLKRGLSDISPLFRQPLSLGSLNQNAGSHEAARPVSPAIPQGEIRSLMFYSPQGREAALLFSGWIASKLAGPSTPCSIISFYEQQAYWGAAEEFTQRETYGAFLQRIYIEAEVFRRWDRNPGDDGKIKPGSRHTVFWDASLEQEDFWEQIIRYADVAVMLVRPEWESWSEIYRMIKKIHRCHYPVRYALLYEGGSEDQKKGEWLYERLAQMVSRRLGASLEWFGLAALPHAGSEGFIQLNPTLWFSKPAVLRPGMQERSHLEYLIGHFQDSHQAASYG